MHLRDCDRNYRGQRKYILIWRGKPFTNLETLVTHAKEKFYITPPVRRFEVGNIGQILSHNKINYMPVLVLVRSLILF